MDMGLEMIIYIGSVVIIRVPPLSVNKLYMKLYSQRFCCSTVINELFVENLSSTYSQPVN